MEKTDRLSSARLCWKGTGGFPMQDGRLWERAFEASVNGAVRVEEAVDPEIVTMSIANPELAADPGMGNVRQNKRRREQMKGHRYTVGMGLIGYISHRLLVKVRLSLFGQRTSPFCWRTCSYPGRWYCRSWKWTIQLHPQAKQK